MFAIYFYMRENISPIKPGFFMGLSDSRLETTSNIFPGATYYRDRKRAQNAAKLLMACHIYISGYKIYEIASDNLCPFFECTSFETASCPGEEGCIGCSVYGNCNFCNREACVNDHAYYKWFAKKNNRNLFSLDEMVLH